MNIKLQSYYSGRDQYPALVPRIFMQRQHFVKREIIINGPRQKAFEYINFDCRGRQF